MDVLIDHEVADNLVNHMDEAKQAVHTTWKQAFQEFEDLKASGAMLGASSDAAQAAAIRTNEHFDQLDQKDTQLLEDVRNAHADDLRTEEESASMFTHLAQQ
ncbi:hypothetical protein [Mycobacteroides abscessus]|uniref:hypothetical protein n=1 Tax=Mycobacteroides abscessus TaxID=36809 RepID=UPI001896917E